MRLLVSDQNIPIDEFINNDYQHGVSFKGLPHGTYNVELSVWHENKLLFRTNNIKIVIDEYIHGTIDDKVYRIKF